MNAADYELAGHHVLVVEDDYFIAEEICAVLRRKGATVIGPAADVEQGRALTAEQQLDCAILDVNLHGEHRISACRRTARTRRSVHLRDGVRRHLPASFAFRDAVYLQKPIDLAALVRAVRQCAGSHRSRHN